jgi:serine kinase of HPr protein (carbohydrate metabolism regulator)
MNIQTILNLIEGNTVTDAESLVEIEYALTSDLMSDVLTLEVENSVLITGLNNMQTIRTAEMSDISCIIIARNRKVSNEMISLANQNKIVIIESPYGVFRVSGILYANGIKPIY